MALRLSLLAACLAAAFVLPGCASDGDGTASFYVKDAATDEFREVHLVITQVSIHQSGGNESSGWKVLFTGSQDVDLLNTTGAKAAFLGEAGLAAGKYQQLRLTASSAYGITMDGNRTDIGLPDKELKVNKGFTVEAGQETQLILDIDLDKSVKEKGDGWEFKPVIGKLYAAKGDKEAKPAAGTVETVALEDDAAA